MTLETLLEQLKTSPESVTFQQVMTVIENHYSYTPQTFTNGELINNAGENAGSCKIFSFAKLNNLNEEQTLNCFGDYYRVDVLQHPNGDDHQNIRNFIKTGWAGVNFNSLALTAC
ncbi:HopJ type III effector protein [Pseudoalteromonas sp. P1-9]|uniref:HopJ type III effector protein n=1 Tax=Pseudoalteromonas sp. P1-9 TaxID=1710354 RepID=UPI0006D63E3E|nr:HopJ type III effector protein [Pseudoalteromonas sp. P1-9]KPV98027.1 HopJ type III effector protein [Pseudoalteromonas sp. P1-9]